MRDPASGTRAREVSNAIAWKALRPAAVGRFRYDTQGWAEFDAGTCTRRTMPDRTSLTVGAVKGSSQRYVRDLRDDAGDGGVTTTILQYRADGLHLEYLKIDSSASGISRSYVFRPDEPPLLLASGAQPGSKQRFHLENDTVSANVTVEVEDVAVVSVHSEKVQTVSLRNRTVFTGEVEGESTTLTTLSTAHSIPITEEVVTRARLGLTRTATEYVSSIVELAPT